MEVSIQGIASKIDDRSCFCSEITNRQHGSKAYCRRTTFDHWGASRGGSLSELCNILLQEQNLEQKEPSEISSDLIPLLAQNQPVAASFSTPHQLTPVSTDSSSWSVFQSFPSKQQTPAASGHIPPVAANIVESAFKTSTESHHGVLEALPSLFSKADTIRETDCRHHFDPVRLEFLKSKPCSLNSF